MKALINYINAGYGALQIVTSEHHRVLKDIVSTAINNFGGVNYWDASGVLMNLARNEVIENDLYTPTELFDKLESGMQQNASSVLWVVADIHLFMKEPDPAMIAIMRNAIKKATTTRNHFIFIGASGDIAMELQHMVTRVEYSLPTREDVAGILTPMEELLPEDNRPEEGVFEQAVDSAMGMTLQEVEDAIALSVVKSKAIDPSVIMREKVKAIESSGCLKYIDTNLTLDDVGGNEVLMNYISLRKESFTKEARDFGCPPPKGVLMVGVAGTGKSLGAKVTASILNRPLISMDVGAVFGSLVGQSEQNMRNALKTVESISPCVLMLDEIEKGLSGSKSSGKTDGGTGSRVIGSLLTWMNDKVADVYVVATANDITSLPPELMRKGRFDELFFVDLPNEIEREKIFEIHLRKRNRDPKKFDVNKLAKATEGFTGAEIEQVIIDALYVAFGNKKKMTTNIIISVIKETSPLSVVSGEQIENLRRWATGRCRMASATAKKSSKQQSGKRKIAVA